MFNIVQEVFIIFSLFSQIFEYLEEKEDQTPGRFPFPSFAGVPIVLPRKADVRFL